MGAHSHSRGWPIIWFNGKWRYADTRQMDNNNRSCPRCGRKPTAEGYDACLGHIVGVVGACCGHGIENGWKIYDKPCSTEYK